jgi:type I restriction enzyme S subunit
MRLGNVITINPESIRNDYSFAEVEYIDISSVGTGMLQRTQRLQFDDAPSRAKRIVRNGDTLLATVRPNLRSFWFARNVQENTIASTGFAVLRAGKGIDARFLYFTVTNQLFTDYLTANAKGAAYPAVDTDTIERAEILFPPLPTQRKIAAILSA